MATGNEIAGWSPPLVPLGTEIVSIIVGSEKEFFGVHRNLICASSKFFTSAFCGGFHEAQVREITLPELDPKVFGFFYRWLYSPPRRVDEPLYQRAQDIECQPDELLFNLHRLSDYLLVPGLQLLVIEQLKDIFSSCDPTIPSNEFIQLLFDDDQLRLTQSYVIKHISYWISKSEDKDPWIEIIRTHDKLAMAMAVEFANLNTTHVDALKLVHPSQIPEFEVGVSDSLVMLTTEARQNDVHSLTISGAKELCKFSSHSHCMDFDCRVPARAKILYRFRHLLLHPGSRINDEDGDPTYTPRKRASPRQLSKPPGYYGL
jgi:hypothetical protein